MSTLLYDALLPDFLVLCPKCQNLGKLSFLTPRRQAVFVFVVSADSVDGMGSFWGVHKKLKRWVIMLQHCLFSPFAQIAIKKKRFYPQIRRTVGHMLISQLFQYLMFLKYF